MPRKQWKLHGRQLVKFLNDFLALNRSVFHLISTSGIWRFCSNFGCLKHTVSAILAASTIAVTAEAGQLPESTNTASLIAMNDQLSNVLQSLCSAQGVNLVLSKKVTGVVNGNFTRQNFGELLDNFSKSFGFIWYYDGAGLYIYSADELESAVIDVTAIDFNKFQTILRQLAILDDRYPLKNLPENHIVYVVGPPRYVSLIKDIATMARQNKIKGFREEMAVQVFPLKRAWAYDIKLKLRDEEITIPGVATILQRVFTQSTYQDSDLFGPKQSSSAAQSTMTTVPGSGLVDKPSITPVNININDKATSGDGGKDRYVQNAAQEYDQQPNFEADKRLNAVVIRDRKDRMQAYADVIASLDVPVGLIEITAAIMDVDANTALSWGIGYRAALAKANVSSSDPNYGTDYSSTYLRDQDVFSRDLGYDSGVAASFLLVSGVSEFLARIRALEAEGKAKILSRPSVLTLANVQAQLRDDKTFYVRVAGDKTVDLFNVSAGILLQVTPHIIEEEQETIEMVVHIEDGSVEDKTVDNIPVIRTSAINTQAKVKEGQSLLIGGYYHENKQKADQMVPFLGRIPVIGWLFKSREKAEGVSQRMFLITPRIIQLNDYAMAEHAGNMTLSLDSTEALLMSTNKIIKAGPVTNLAVNVKTTESAKDAVAKPKVGDAPLLQPIAQQSKPAAKTAVPPKELY